MKITVGIPSRGRPLELIAAVLSLDKLRSGGHAVDYVIGHDEGDAETLAAVDRLVAHGVSLRSSFGPRPLGLGEIHNRMAAAADPDATFLLWSDRVVPINEHWDHAIAMGVMQFPLRVLWLDSIHLIGAGQFILTPKWRAASPGPPCPGLFPFWFEDSWVEEVDAFVHGHPRVATYAKCAGQRTAKTNRMRELHFWIDTYSALRPERLREAGHIAERLGVPPRADIDDLVAFYEKRDRDFHAREKVLTEQFGATEVPDESYLRAKDRAIARVALRCDSLQEAAE